MEDLTSQVAAKILEVLPEATQQANEAANHIVGTMGLENVSELALIAEADLSQFLGVFKTRRLIQTWKEKAEGTNGDDSESNTRGPRPGVNIHNPSDQSSGFQIDWEDIYRIADSIKPRLKAGKMLRSKHKREVVSRIVNQVRTKVPHAKRDIFRKVMEQMKKKYPLSFKSELFEGKLDNNSLCFIMQTKFDNGRRPARRTRTEQEAPAIKPAYGCKKWRLASIPEGETAESLNHAQEQLAEYYEMTRPSAWDWTFIDVLMEKTYRLQREDINKQAEQLIEMTKREQQKNRKKRNKQKKGQDNNSQNENDQENDEDPDDFTLLTTEQIRDRWPFLFHPTCMINHFNKLTGTDFGEELDKFMQNIEKIIKFLVDTNKDGKPRKLRKKMKRAKELLPPHNAEIVALLLLLISRFNEKEGSLWMIIDPSAKEEDVPTLCTIPKTPRLIIAGEEIFKPTTIFFTMDKQVLGVADNLLQGIGLLFASYFVFNLEYDADAQVTLEFIQRCIASINPEKGNKRPKKTAGGHSSTCAVHSYLRKFNKTYDDYVADQEEDEGSDEEAN